MSVRRLYQVAFATIVLCLAVVALVPGPEGIALSIAGIVIGLITFGVQEAKGILSAKRRIVFVGSSASSFTNNIARGLEKAIQGHLDYELSKFLPPPGQVATAFQIEALRRQDVRSAHAVVIRPAADHEKLLDELVAISAAGVFCVVVDTKVPNAVFYRSGVRLPRFVGSDFRYGGQLIGWELARLAAAEAADGIILFSGPRDVAPNEIRAFAACYELQRSLPGGPIIIRELRSFEPQGASKELSSGLVELDHRLGRRAARIVVHSGTDRLGAAMSKSFAEDPSLHQGREIWIVGYDGVRGTDDVLLASETPRMVATVDTLPRFQGQEAGNFVILGFNGEAHLREKNSIVKPRLLSAPQW